MHDMELSSRLVRDCTNMTASREHWQRSHIHSCHTSWSHHNPCCSNSCHPRPCQWSLCSITLSVVVGGSWISKYLLASRACHHHTCNQHQTGIENKHPNDDNWIQAGKGMFRLGFWEYHQLDN